MHPVSVSKRTAFSKPALTLSLLAVITATLSACARNEAAQNPALAAPPQVTVAQVLSKPVTEFDEFTGRFEAIDRVEIRPRVSGYISSVNFTEGSEVKKGDVLFVIDQRPYAAELKHAQAQLAQSKSALALAKSEKAREMTRSNCRFGFHISTRSHATSTLVNSSSIAACRKNAAFL